MTLRELKACSRERCQAFIIPNGGKHTVTLCSSESCGRPKPIPGFLRAKLDVIEGGAQPKGEDEEQHYDSGYTLW